MADLGPLYSTPALAGAIALLVSALTILLLWVPAKRFGFVDHPDLKRKNHQSAALLTGGVAVFAGFTLTLIYFLPGMPAWIWMVTGALMMLTVGMLDDRLELTPRTRFIAQIAVSLVMVYLGDAVLHDFGELLGGRTLYLSWAAVPVTVFCAVGVMNAMNMIDGMDGLAGSVSVVCLAFVALLAGLQQDILWLSYSLGLAGAVLGFLVFNLRLPGRRSGLVFLGDGGSLVIGFLLAWVMVAGSQGDQRVFAPVTALWLMALPLMDTVFVMSERIRAGKSPFSPGQDHLHHLFLRSGYSVNATLLIYLSGSVVLAGSAVSMQLLGVAEWAIFIGFLALCAGYYWLIARAWKQGRWLGRPVGTRAIQHHD